MAFQPNAARNDSRNYDRNTQADNWKAAGFLNLYLPNMDGKRTKLGAIPLKEGKPNEKLMLDWLKEDPSRVQIILSKLEIEYRSSEPTEGSKFDLPV
jgi:hypothetical protein